MLSFKRSRLFAIGMPILLMLFALNHIEYHHRRNIPETNKLWKSQIVKKDDASQASHNTIVINESAVPDGTDSLFLHFSTLGTWAYDPQANTPCPESIKALSGHDASCVGFMYPLEAGDKMKTFCLLRSTQTCCYGPRPQYSQYLFVEMDKPVKFERLAPVLLKGKFFVDPQPGQGFIYRMEGSSLIPAEDDAPEIDASKAALNANLPRFDFGALEKFGANRGQGIPNELIALDGKKMVLDGYLVSRSKDAPPHILLSNKWWDGVSTGSPPTLYSAVMIFPKDESQVPALWEQKGVFTGILSVNANPSEWKKNGIVSLSDAVAGVPDMTGKNGSNHSSPYLPFWGETLIFFAFLMFTTCRRNSLSTKLHDPEKGLNHE